MGMKERQKERKREKERRKEKTLAALWTKGFWDEKKLENFDKKQGRVKENKTSFHFFR